MGKIRIFVDAHSFDKEHQGTRTFIRRIYTELVNLPGNNYQLFFGAVNTDALRLELADIAGARFLKYRFGSTLLRLLIDVPRIIRREKIDFAHFQYITPPIRFCRYIVTTHDVLFRDFPGYFSWAYRISRHFLFSHSINRSDIATTVSEYSLDAIRRALSVKWMIITPNSIDPELFELYDQMASRRFVAERIGKGKLILCVSRFEPRKNQAVLLSAYEKMRLYEQGFKLVFLGHKSAPVPEFDSLLDSLPEKARREVYIKDNHDNNDLYHFYRAADVFVYPSAAEGFGLPPLEAGALGIPVICSNQTALASYTFFGRGHIDPNDFPLFVAVLKEYCGSPPPLESRMQIVNEIKKRYGTNEAAIALDSEIRSHFKNNTG
jgi:glycosyltransferase involved in cell wall biosynthesis